MGCRRKPGVVRHGPAGKSGGLGIAKQRQRVPHVLPGTAGGGVGVEDEKVELLFAQVVAGGEAGLATTDDDAVIGMHWLK